ncbi:hypothetical protein [Rheinheimera sp. WS51]|uniref:hypothetical protein n=1 Tax=Rheinheimera sp. WS51 TaxID=3425886 RepID=UPI003D8DBF5A
MDEYLGYAAWLIQQNTDQSTQQLSATGITFADKSRVLFSLLDHTTCIDTAVDLDPVESSLD